MQKMEDEENKTLYLNCDKRYFQAHKLAPILGPLGVSPKHVVDALERQRQGWGYQVKFNITIHLKRRAFPRGGYELESVELRPNVAGMIKVALRWPNDGKRDWRNRRNGGEHHEGDVEGRVIAEIAMLNRSHTRAESFKMAVKEVLGTAQSLGPVTIDGRSVKETLRMVDEGEWDEMLSEVTSTTPW